MPQPEINPSSDSSAGYTPERFAPVRPHEALSTFPYSMTVWDFDGRIRSSNFVADQLLGSISFEREGRSIFELAHPDEMAADRWLVLNAVAVPTEKLIFVPTHDITKRKQAEQALRDSQPELLHWHFMTITNPDVQQNLGFQRGLLEGAARWTDLGGISTRRGIELSLTLRITEEEGAADGKT